MSEVATDMPAVAEREGWEWGEAGEVAARQWRVVDGPVSAEGAPRSAVIRPHEGAAPVGHVVQGEWKDALLAGGDTCGHRSAGNCNKYK